MRTFYFKFTLFLKSFFKINRGRILIRVNVNNLHNKENGGYENETVKEHSYRQGNGTGQSAG